jgi:hypothetical protein
MLEDREGGTTTGRTTPDGATYQEELKTRRADGGVVGRIVLRGSKLLSIRGSGTLQRHDHGFGQTRARSASFDVGYTLDRFEFNAAVFGSRIDDAVQARRAASDVSKLELVNASGPVRTYGTELLARFHREGVHVTATHVFMHSSEPHPESGE